MCADAKHGVTGRLGNGDQRDRGGIKDQHLIVDGRRVTRPNAKNAGETALLYEGDAKSDAFALSSWCELRHAIAVCPDLPEEARQSLIEQGDAAADG